VTSSRSELSAEARRALADVVGCEDPDVLAIFLSGSAARGMATERSDVDVYLVVTEEAGARRRTTKSEWIDEIVVTLAELESPGQLGTDDWWYRWSFAWVDVLRDDTGGRLGRALDAQAKLGGREQVEVLVDRLDGFINFAFRSLKSERDGRPLEQRLDAAESVTSWLDTLFALAGRVRPYNKYLVWELRTHPVDLPGCTADELLPLVERVLDGEAAAVREAFAVVERAARAFDERHGDNRLGEVIDGWGESQLDLLRGPGLVVERTEWVARGCSQA
jgi:predicted nucleotidyltransferase